MLRVMIQKKVGTVWQDTDLEYTFEKVAEIVRARTHEYLSVNEKPEYSFFGKVKTIKREWTLEEVEKALEDAFKFFLSEFKFKTTSLS